MSDAVRSIDDLDDDAAVYCATGPLPSIVHLSTDCRHYKRAQNKRERTARVLHPDTPICQRCTGTDSPAEPDNPLARRHKLEGTNPKEVGLSPLVGEEGHK